ncbi:hypothetical protein HPP92_006105 [Vanilla planifolia]|uniref:peptidyl-tRNA hydrolase n=1 Tax=Vanilla planifolia TaxID=51239 RepID=A0A835RMY8_VANPL|nr:hypothetical protein HPP92_006105 [Vanilla planifolia]
MVEGIISGQSIIKEGPAEEPWHVSSLRPENYLPGLAIGFLLGLLVDFAGAALRNSKLKPSVAPVKLKRSLGGNNGGGDELKMVLVVRQDLKMGAGKVASQCAHAATGMYAELLQSNRSLLRQWEQCGQPKIVVTCKNLQEMNKLKDTADLYGLPTLIIADAGRTQVQEGSKTVLAIGPGKKAVVDSVTGKQRLL